MIWLSRLMFNFIFNLVHVYLKRFLKILKLILMFCECFPKYRYFFLVLPNFSKFISNGTYGLLYIIESEILFRFWFLRSYIVIYGVEKNRSSQSIPVDIVLSFLLIPRCPLDRFNSSTIHKA